MNAAPLEGRVLELHSSVPVERAQVSLRALSRDGHDATAETGEDGTFRVSAITPGRYTIEVSKSGYAASALFFTYATDSVIVLRLAKYGTIRGRVTTNAGEPAMNGSVFPLAGLPRTSSGDLLGRGKRLVTRVDDQGNYRLFGLPPGHYTVAVSYSGAGTTAGSGVALALDSAAPRILPITSGEIHEDVDLVLPLGEAHSLEGHVDPCPPNGPVLVTLTPREQPEIVVGQALTDEHGRFRIENIQPGQYDLFAAGPSDISLNGGLGGLLVGSPLFGRGTSDLTNHDEEGTQIAMRAGGKVGFRLVGEGSSAENDHCGRTAALRLTATEEWGTKIDRETQVHLDSATVLSDVPPARYLVALDGLPHSCYYLGEPLLDFTAGPPETVTLSRGRGASVEGRLLGVQPDNPADYIVLFLPESPDDKDPAMLIVSVNREGLFSVETLRPGTYRIQATRLSEWLSPRWKLDVQQMAPLSFPPGAMNLELPVASSQPH